MKRGKADTSGYVQLRKSRPHRASTHVGRAGPETQVGQGRGGQTSEQTYRVEIGLAVGRREKRYGAGHPKLKCSVRNQQWIVSRLRGSLVARSEAISCCVEELLPRIVIMIASMGRT